MTTSRYFFIIFSPSLSPLSSFLFFSVCFQLQDIDIIVAAVRQARVNNLHSFVYLFIPSLSFILFFHMAVVAASWIHS